MAINGLITTALQTVGVKIDMDDAIRLLPTWDVPLQTRLGSAPAVEIRIDWLEDALTPSSFTTSVVASTGPWTLTLPDSSFLRVGDLVVNTAQAGKPVEVTTVTDATHIIVTDTL